ncbi:MAG: hypothetical protein QOF51_2789, partial [Chloroflexota bacterium]|nr:hypothetical protein [Chloroflexota bacterium]
LANAARSGVLQIAAVRDSLKKLAPPTTAEEGAASHEEAAS